MDTHYTYTHALKTQLEKRVMANPRYSLRAFARDLGMKPSSLSLVLNGKQGLSVEKANTLVSKLPFDKQEREMFLMSVRQKHSRSKAAKEIAARTLKTLQSQNEWNKGASISEDLLEGWFTMALFEYLKLFPTYQPQEIAETFEVTTAQVLISINRLKAAEMIEIKKNKVVVCGQLHSFGKNIPSSIVREFHKDVVNKSLESIELKNFEDRETSSTFMAIEKQDMDAFKNDLRQFRKAMCEKYKITKKNNIGVFCLSLNLFPLTKWSGEIK